MILVNYLLYYGIIIPISLLPFGILYRISDILFVLIYHVIGYRKKVVRQNLLNSFPAKSKEEITTLEKAFFKHFCDIIIETLKGFSITEQELKQRVTYSNLNLIKEYHKKKQSVIVATAHYGNWEYAALSMAVYFPHTCMGVYHPLKNKFFNQKLIESRGKFGLNLVSPKKISAFYRKNDLVVAGFIADQTPHNVYKCHWMKFMNQETPVFLGAENFATKLNQPVLYGRIEKISRGNYTITFEKVTDTPIEEPKYFITEKHTNLLEKQIISKPEFWLWTHKRWKRKKPNDFIKQ